MVAQLSTVQVASPARLPALPAGLPRRLLVLAGAVVGLVLGAALALLQEAARERRARALAPTRGSLVVE